MRTNISNLPEGEYFTEIGYSQQYPYVVVKRTPKTVTLARVEVKPSNEWKPEFTHGGFFGHCLNQSEQKWDYLFTRQDETVVVRVSKKKPGYYMYKGRPFRPDEAIYFYDYNF